VMGGGTGSPLRKHPVAWWGETEGSPKIGAVMKRPPKKMYFEVSELSGINLLATPWCVLTGYLTGEGSARNMAAVRARLPLPG